MRYANKRDLNHHGIVASLKQIPGISVADASRVGDNFVDIVVGYHKKNYLFEIKSDGEKPRASQLEFYENWRGTIHVAWSLGDVLKVLGISTTGGGK